jgi:hypothetical protein
MLVKKLNQSHYKNRIEKKSNNNNLFEMQKIGFSGGDMKVYLTSGRILIVPLKNFPEIKKLTSAQKNKYHIAGGISLDFDDSDEVYHINELIGISN